MAELGNDNVCSMCNGTNFYTESGFYYCTQCSTQKEDANEQLFDTQHDNTIRTHSIKIRSEKSTVKEISGWTSWELYNFVMVGLANELIEIGVDPAVKVTILQLWTYYLSKLEVAFTSKKRKEIPKMSRKYSARDAEIIFGKIQKKKKRKRGSRSSATSNSFLSASVASTGSNNSRQDFFRKQRKYIAEHNARAKDQRNTDSEADDSFNQSLHSLQSSFSNKSSTTKPRVKYNKRAKKQIRLVKELSKKVPFGKKTAFRKTHMTDEYKKGGDILTPEKLFAIIYLALLINKQKIYLSDILRFSSENHLSFYKMINLIPPEISLTRKDKHILIRPSFSHSHSCLREACHRVAEFLDITELPKPDILGLIGRYCEELELPQGIALYAQKIYLSAPCDMIYNSTMKTLPNYEARAMAYIIIVLKILFGLDGITEKEISRVVEKVNRAATDKNILSNKLFNFCEWQQFIECRKTILASVHFPSKIKYDPEGTDNPHLYLRFIGQVNSKRNNDAEPTETLRRPQAIEPELLAGFDQSVSALNDNDIQLKESIVFPPSLTPQKSYIARLEETSHIDVPYVLQSKFSETKVGYMTKPDKLVELASQCDISLKVVDSSAHYLEKIVPYYGCKRSLRAGQEIKPTKLEEIRLEEARTIKRSDHPLEYLYKQSTHKLKVNTNCLQHYSSICNRKLELDETLDFQEDSLFDKVLPDGRLDIDATSESEDEESSEEADSDDDTVTLDKQFFKSQHIPLFDHEFDSLPEITETLKNVSRKDLLRRFAKPKSSKQKTEDDKKEYKRIIVISDNELSGDEANKEAKANDKRNKVKDKEGSFDLSELDITIDGKDTSAGTDGKCKSEAEEDEEILFRPYKNYWMYHWGKMEESERFFEMELPENFLWLLRECASMIEMSPKLLQEQLQLVEFYHLDVLKPDKSESDKDYELDVMKARAALCRRSFLKKWKCE